MNRPITAYVSGGVARKTAELTGGIVNGRLTLTVKIPDYSRWYGIKVFIYSLGEVRISGRANYSSYEININNINYPTI